MTFYSGPNSSSFIEQSRLIQYEGKNIFVGYGVADPKGDDCRVFEASITGLPNDIKICLPLVENGARI